MTRPTPTAGSGSPRTDGRNDNLPGKEASNDRPRKFPSHGKDAGRENKTLPFAAQNHTFGLAKPYLSHAKR